jgi:hypothetical protein
VSAQRDEPRSKPAPPPDPKDREIERLQRENERLRRKVEQLEKELEAARRAAKRQAAPFSKGAPSTAPKVAGRRAGSRHGRHGHRPPPVHIDETIDVPLPDACPQCGGALAETRVADQMQEELPGGNRFARGATTQQILTSVVHTARLRDLDTRDVLVDLLRARQPVPSRALVTLQQTEPANQLRTNNWGQFPHRGRHNFGFQPTADPERSHVNACVMLQVNPTN